MLLILFFTVPLPNLQVRLHTMHYLLQFSPGDLINCENWSTLKEAVNIALMDHNAELAVSHIEV